MAIGGITLIVSSSWLFFQADEEFMKSEARVRAQLINIVSEFTDGMNRMAVEVGSESGITAHIGYPNEKGEMEIVRPGARVSVLQEVSKRDDVRKALGKFDLFLLNCEKDYADPKKKGDTERFFPPESVRRMRTRLREHSEEMEYFWLLQDKRLLFQNALTWSLWLGLAMATGGFALWYVQVQRHVDAGLRRKALGKS